MIIDLTRRYAAGEVLPTGPELFELQRLVSKHRTAFPDDVALTAAAVNAALEREQAEQALPPSAAADIVAERIGRYRQVPANGPIDWSDPRPAEQLQATVDDVRARRTRGITVPVRIDPDPAVIRIAALNAAAEVYQGRAHDVGTDVVLEAAADFEAYLRGDELPTPVVVPPRLQPVDDTPPAPSGPLVLGWTFEQLYRIADHADPAEVERVTALFDAALADDRLEPGGRPLIRTGLAILRRQR